MSEGLEERAAALRAAGIDPEQLEREGARVLRALHGGELEEPLPADEETLAELERLLRDLHRAEVAPWTPFHFGARPLAEACPGQAALFRELVPRLSELARCFAARGYNGASGLQRGLPRLARLARERARPQLLAPCLDLALELAREGIDPHETIHCALPTALALAEDERQLAPLLAALGETLRACDALGVVGTLPILLGVEATLQAFGADDPGEAPAALAELVELIEALVAADVSPYPVLEYGLTAALAACAGLEWLRGEVLPLAWALAAAGVNPHETLGGGVPTLAGLDEPAGRQVLELAQELADEGLDPGPFLHWVVGPLRSAEPDGQAFSAALRRIGGLVRALRQRGISPLLTFRYGLPHLVELERERLLDLALAQAEAGRDPGPLLEYGVGAIRAQLGRQPALAQEALDVALRQVAAGIDPRRPLEGLLPALGRVAGQDEELFRELLGEVELVLLRLHARGVDLGTLCTYALPALGRALQGEPAGWRALLERIEGQVAVLAEGGVDPYQTLSHGLSAAAGACGGDLAALGAVLDLSERLGRGGIDPAPLLARAAPPLLRRGEPGLLERAATLREAGVRLDPPAASGALADALAALAEPAGARLGAALDWAEGLCARGLDPSPALGGVLPRWLAALDEETPCGPLLDALARAAAAGREGEPAAPAPWSPLASAPSLTAPLAAWIEAGAAAEVPGGVEALLGELPALAALPPATRGALLQSGSAAALARAGEARSELAPVWGALLTRVTRAADAAEDAGLARALQAGLAGVARSGRGPSWGEPLDALLELAPLAEELVATAAPLALCAPLEQRAAALRDVAKLPLALEADPRGWVLRQLARLGGLARRLPEAWRGLLVPTLLSQRGGASATLGVLERLEPRIGGPRSLDLLRRVVTQRGAGAVDVLSGLFLRGCHEGQIRSLEDEAELLEEFLQRFPFTAPEAYAAYRAAALGEGQGVEALLEELRELGAAVVAGEVSEVQAGHALFPAVLYHVFPPALSVGRERYAWLYRVRADHPAHVRAWIEREGPPPSEPLRLGRGGYRLREGAELDPRPWATLAASVARVHEEPALAEGDPELAPLALGQALLEGWGAGKLGQEETRAELLCRLYRAYRAGGAELPTFAPEPRILLAYREFLADSCKELVQEALRAAREEDPERYRRVVTRRLAPRRRVGRGLLRAVRATLGAHAAGELTRARALERLARQLQGFACDEAERAALLRSPPGEVAAALRALEPLEVEVRLGEEHARLLGDLCGQDLAAMQRELFGGEGEPGKLEHAEDAEGERTEVRVEVTKRRAHAPIGFCEGVCTATDAELWDDPRFLQAILWGPEQVALGGLHLLIEGDALILPGINPSLRLLQQVGDEAVLEALLAWAVELARAWGLREVGVPTHPGIASNRARLRELLRSSAAPVRSTGGVEFSRSPYRYVVDEVRVVWSAGSG